MLHFFRQNNTSIISRIVLALISLSFAVWGLGSLFRPSNKPSDIVANIGEHLITLSSIVAKMDETNVPKSQRQEFYPLILQSKIQEIVTSLEAHRLGFKIPDAFLRHAIQSLPFLHTDSGQFDGARLQQLMDSGMLRKEILFQYVFSLLTEKQLSPIFFTANLTQGGHALNLFKEAAALYSFTIHLPEASTFISTKACDHAVSSGDVSRAVQSAITSAKSGEQVQFISVPERRSLKALHVSRDYLPRPSVTAAEIKEALLRRFPPITSRSIVRLEASNEADLSTAISSLKSNLKMDLEALTNVTPSLSPHVTDDADLEGCLKMANSLNAGDSTPVTKEGDVFVAAVVLSKKATPFEPSDTDRMDVRKEVESLKQQVDVDKIRAELEHSVLEPADLEKAQQPGVRFMHIENIDAQGCVFWGANTSTLFTLPLDKEALSSIFSANLGQVDLPLTLEDGSHLIFVVSNIQEPTTLEESEVDASNITADVATPLIIKQCEEEGARCAEAYNKSGKTKAIGSLLAEPTALTDIPLLITNNGFFSLDNRILLATTPKNKAVSIVTPDGMIQIITVQGKKAGDPYNAVKAYSEFKEKLASSVSDDLKTAWAESLYKQHKVQIIHESYNTAVKEFGEVNNNTQ